MKDRENVHKVVISSNVFFFFLLSLNVSLKFSCLFGGLKERIQANQLMFEQIKNLRHRMTNLEKNIQFKKKMKYLQRN